MPFASVPIPTSSTSFTTYECFSPVGGASRRSRGGGLEDLGAPGRWVPGEHGVGSGQRLVISREAPCAGEGSQTGPAEIDGSQVLEVENDLGLPIGVRAGCSLRPCLEKQPMDTTVQGVVGFDYQLALDRVVASGERLDRVL